MNDSSDSPGPKKIGMPSEPCALQVEKIEKNVIDTPDKKRSKKIRKDKDKSADAGVRIRVSCSRCNGQIGKARCWVSVEIGRISVG